VSCLGGGNGADGPGGIALLDHDTFDVLKAWETDRGDQYLAYDAWWHLNQNTLITSEWGTPSMIEDGVNPELLLGQKYGHRLHFWDLAAGKLLQTVDLGAQHQMALELMVSRGGGAPANLHACQSTSRDSQPCSATWASRAR
jgi:methanethiol oxidase